MGTEVDPAGRLIREVMDEVGEPYVVIRVRAFVGNSVDLAVDAGGPGVVDTSDIKALLALCAGKLAHDEDATPD